MFFMAGSRASFSCVVLDRIAGSDAPTYYHVSFARDDGSSELQKSFREDEAGARAHAHLLSRQRGLPLVDRVHGDIIVRGPERLDETLKEWAARLGYLSRPLPGPPDGFPCAIRLAERSATIEIPPARFEAWHFGMMVGAAVVTGIFWTVAFFVFARVESWAPKLLILAILGPATFALIAAYVFGYGARQTIEASSERLRVTNRWWRFTRTGELEAADILELHVSRNLRGGSFGRRNDFPRQAPIVAQTREATLRFAHYLTPVERIHLRELLIRVLAASSDQSGRASDL